MTRILTLVALLMALVSCSGDVVCSCPSQPVPGVAVSIGPWVARHPEARRVQVCFSDLCDVLRPVSNGTVLAGGSVSDARKHPLLVRVTDARGINVLQREIWMSLRDTRVQACCGMNGRTTYTGTATLEPSGELFPG